MFSQTYSKADTCVRMMIMSTFFSHQAIAFTRGKGVVFPHYARRNSHRIWVRNAPLLRAPSSFNFLCAVEACTSTHTRSGGRAARVRPDFRHNGET